MECMDNYQDCDENVYENTRICIGKRKPDIDLDTIELQAKERHIKADSSISEISLDAKDLLTNLEQYETLRSVTRESDGRNNDEENKDQSIKWEDLPKKIRIIIYALSLMLVMLFIIDVIAAVVIVLSLPKNEVHGTWTLWSAWSNCDATCDNGTQTRYRLCYNPSVQTKQLECNGSSTESTKCERSPCLDGSWSNWGSWGSCSESCGGGIKTRLRTCTNPRPSPFGKSCDGSSEQVVLCNKNTCDVHGTWTLWSAWSNCDVACDNGTQTRYRLCYNPSVQTKQQTEQLECNGSSTESIKCQRSPCLDGAWSIWGSWGSCSESCGGGIKSRLRTCTNPRPSPFGKGCDGSSEQVVLCNQNACADGAWSYWGSWGSCSVSCSGGIRSRLRTCTNPRPSPFGKGCDGSAEQVVLCNKQTCTDHKVSFLAYGSTTVTSSSVLKFPTVSFNSGNGYSTSTGRFTCKIPGIYNFAVTLTKQRRDIDQINAYLRINGLDRLRLHADPDDHDNIDYGSYSLSVTGNFYLKTNEYVDVYTVPNNFYNDYSTSFTGVLVIPDN